MINLIYTYRLKISASLEENKQVNITHFACIKAVQYFPAMTIQLENTQTH